MSLEALKIELNHLLDNIEEEIQLTETKTTGANIHDFMGVSAAMRQLRVAVQDGRFDKLNGTAEHYRWTIVLTKQQIMRLRLMRHGKSGNEAYKEAKEVFNPGPYPKE